MVRLLRSRKCDGNLDRKFPNMVCLLTHFDSTDSFSAVPNISLINMEARFPHLVSEDPATCKNRILTHFAS